MKPPQTDTGYLLEAPDRYDIANAPTHYGFINIDGVCHPVVGWRSDNATSPHSMIKLTKCDWQLVHDGPKWFGMTEKQASEAEAMGLEF